MILWINGAFGSGKTQTANELLRRSRNAMLYDPETIGYWLRANEPKALQKPDFQDEPLWRQFNFEMLLSLSRRFHGVIIVPMTLVSPVYYDEIIGRLRRSGVTVSHFVIDLSAKSLRKRQHMRFEGRRSWAAARSRACLRAFRSGAFENRVAADGLTVAQTAEKIAALAGLPLAPRASWLRQRWNILATQCAVMR